MEISELPQRLGKQQKYTVNERLQILEVWDTLLEYGQRSALCRRLGVDPSSVNRWDRQRRDGVLVKSDASKNKYVLNKRERIEYLRLQRENEKLKTQLEQSESAVEVLGKASELLASLAKSSQLKTPPSPEQPPIPPAFQGPPRTS